MSTQDDLATRYGAPAPWRRRALVGAVALVVVVAGGWLAWVTIYHADPAAESELVSFEIVDEHTVTAVVAVELGDDDVQARCTLRAFSEDHAVVGEITFEPVAADGPRYEEQIRTARRASALESIGCTTPDQPRPR